MPVTPQNEAGWRIEPPVSVPVAAGARRGSQRVQGHETVGDPGIDPAADGHRHTRHLQPSLQRGFGAEAVGRVGHLARLHRGRPVEDPRALRRNLMERRLRLLYLAPERLRVESTRQLLEDCLFILDNACTCLDPGALQRRAGERAIMKRVGEWAADTPEEHLNLLELSQVAGVSLRQLQHAFKAYTGMTPTHWLRLRRLNSAHRQLLSSSPLSSSRVASTSIRPMV